MRAKLKEVDSALARQQNDDLLQKQLQIAYIKYTEAQNIVLAYQRFFGKDISIRGTVKDIQIVDNKICLFIACMIYGYTDACILQVLDMSEANIEKIQRLVVGTAVSADGKGNISNNTVYLDNTKIKFKDIGD